MTNNTQNIIPDAKGLFYALRNSGYSNEAAIADLIDNSLDANAQNVKVDFDDLKTIYIVDDGVGMSFDTLKQAIRLGGKKVHDSAGDLGKYGLGLITASLSMGRKIRIITKNGGEYHTAVFDYDSIVETNTFSADFRESTEVEISSFDYRTDNTDSGTVLIIDNCDKIQYKTANDLSKALEESIKHTFRAFIRDGRKIFINSDRPVSGTDPLFLDDAKTRKLVNKDVDVRSADGSVIGKLSILAVALPEFDKGLTSKLGINIKNQGFYILRNKREIAEAMEFPEVFRKHNDYNYLRVEIDFDSALDDLMGINYTKHNATPSKEIINILKKELFSTFELMRRESHERADRNRAKRKANPFANNKPEEKKSATESSDDKDGKVKSSTTKPEGVNSQPLSGQTSLPFDDEPKELNTEFSVRFQTEKDPLLSVSVDGETMKIRYNGKNDYYVSKFVNSEYGADYKEEFDKIITATVKTCFDSQMPVKQIASVIEGISKQL